MTGHCNQVGRAFVRLVAEMNMRDCFMIGKADSGLGRWCRIRMSGSAEQVVRRVRVRALPRCFTHTMIVWLKVTPRHAG